MDGPVARLLPDGKRLHLQHGPIDLVIGVDQAARQLAFRAATERFQSVLRELVCELALLRCAPGAKRPTGIIAQKMYHAARSHAKDTFVTPMAAVAGAVADEVLASMQAAVSLTRAYVNNGGDIALYLSQDQCFRMAIAALDNADLGRIGISASDGIGGLATSGLGGRSLSSGIADAVTVLAPNAAQADVAATLIANAVDIPGHKSISRMRADDVDPDSDLASRLVVTDCANLTRCEVNIALARGLAIARKMKARGLIAGAALFLRGQCQTLTVPRASLTRKVTENA